MNMKLNLKSPALWCSLVVTLTGVAIAVWTAPITGGLLAAFGCSLVWATQHFAASRDRLQGFSAPGSSRGGRSAMSGKSSGKSNGKSSGQATKPPAGPSVLPERKARVQATDDRSQLVHDMLAEGRYALLLRPQIAENLSAEHLTAANEELDEWMSIVPAGSVMLQGVHSHPPAKHITPVEGFYLDRFPVTNAEYQRFVDHGGYEQMSLWDPDIWSGVLEFVDQTGQPGPAFWSGGRYAEGEEDLPVVGVCWFEANAYASWAGKRLATDAEWVKAGTWPVTPRGTEPVQRRYPWGDAMDRGIANIWGSGPGHLVPVDQFADGVSVGGVYQMVGNVWEWTSTDFGIWESESGSVFPDGAMKSIRGGAYDTYFENQTACQFQSGERPLSRKHNIGFRCALGVADIVPSIPDPSDDRDVSPEPSLAGISEETL